MSDPRTPEDLPTEAPVEADEPIESDAPSQGADPDMIADESGVAAGEERVVHEELDEGFDPDATVTSRDELR